MSEQEIYLLLTDTGSILTRTIKLFTRKKYNHISLAFDAVLEDTFSFGRKKANNHFYRRLHTRRCDIRFLQPCKMCGVCVDGFRGTGEGNEGVCFFIRKGQRKVSL